jgi:hypothetical protein
MPSRSVGELTAMFHGPSQIAPGLGFAEFCGFGRRGCSPGPCVIANCAHRRADFERFSAMSENRETGWWSRRDLNPSETPKSPGILSNERFLIWPDWSTLPLEGQSCLAWPQWNSSTTNLPRRAATSPPLLE